MHITKLHLAFLGCLCTLLARETKVIKKVAKESSKRIFIDGIGQNIPIYSVYLPQYLWPECCLNLSQNEYIFLLYINTKVTCKNALLK